MPQTNLVQFLVRQGTDSQRQTVTLQSGELGSITDPGYNRLFIGDGVTPGGVPVASKFYWITSWTATSATILPYVHVSDLVYNIQLQTLFALTAYPATVSSSYLPIIT